MTEQTEWSVLARGPVGATQILLRGGPLDGAIVEGPRCETEDGLPDAVRLGTGGAYVRGEDLTYLWRDEPLEGGSA